MKKRAYRFLLGVFLLFPPVSAMDEDNTIQKNSENKLALQQNLSGISEGKDIVVAIGNTGSGKSTLLNLLIGKKLKVSEEGYVLENQDLPFFKISHGTQLATLEPQFVVVKENNIVFVDLPGLTPRGKGEELETILRQTACMKDIITQAKTVRFLFIESKDSLESKRGENFKKLFNSVSQFLPKEQITGTSIFVLTKSHTNNQQNLVDFLVNKLDEDCIDLLEKRFLCKKANPNIFSFLNSQKFVQENEVGELIIDDEKAQQVLNHTRERLLKGIMSLQGVKVQEINMSSLLKSNVGSDISEAFKALVDLHFQETFSIDKFYGEETQLGLKIISSFKDKMRSEIQSKWGWIRKVDVSLYEYGIEQAFYNVDYKINELRDLIKNNLVKNEHKMLKDKNIGLQNESFLNTSPIDIKKLVNNGIEKQELINLATKDLHAFTSGVYQIVNENKRLYEQLKQERLKNKSGGCTII